MKFFIFLIFIIFVLCFWHFFLRNRLDRLKSIQGFNFIKKMKFEKDQNVVDERILNEKKINDEITLKGIDHEQDIKLFDDVAQLMFEKEIKNQELQFADQIQYEFLNKMPTQARSQIHQFDLGEWSIFWAYDAQSLEYYASKYGVFYTHVDRNGVEHKMELKYSV